MILWFSLSALTLAALLLQPFRLLLSLIACGRRHHFVPHTAGMGSTMCTCHFEAPSMAPNNIRKKNGAANSFSSSRLTTNSRQARALTRGAARPSNSSSNQASNPLLPQSPLIAVRMQESSQDQQQLHPVCDLRAQFGEYENSGSSPADAAYAPLQLPARFMAMMWHKE